MKTEQAVSILKSFVQSTEKTPSPMIREAAEDYQRACNELNSSLSRLEELLTRSLRPEAIHFANIEPKLEDQVALLDFQGREIFCREAPFNDLAVPPALNMEVIKHLQSAYVENSLTENLYRILRRQVLEQAPVRERLNSLRELSNHDRINAVLIEDIEKLEKDILFRISQRLRKAVKDKDFELIGELTDEYYSITWTMPPAPEIADMLEKNRGMHLEQQLKDFSNQALEAMRKKDIVGAKKYFENWEAKAKELGVQHGDRYWSHVSPVVKWLQAYENQADNKSYAETELIKLKNIMREKNTTTWLMGLWEIKKRLEALEKQHGKTVEAVGIFNDGIQDSLKGIFLKLQIPNDLEDLYEKTSEELEKSIAWWERFILACVFGGGMLILISFLIFVVAKNR